MVPVKPKHIVLTASLFLLLTILYTGSGQELTDFEVPMFPFITDFDEVTLVGVLGNDAFPVAWYGVAPAKDSPEFVQRQVLTVLDNNSNPVFLHGGRYEMIMAGSGCNVVFGETLMDHISDAHQLGLRVKVKGRLFNEVREGKEYTVLDVSKIEVLEPEKLPLVIYDLELVESRYQTITGLGNRVIGVQSFKVGTEQTGVGSKNYTHVFMLHLNELDRFTVDWNASGSVYMELYAPQNTLLNANVSRWGYRAGVYGGLDTMLRRFECHIPGVYNLVFYSENGNLTNVELHIEKLRYDPNEVFFRESVGLSSGFGGISSMGGHYQLPDPVFRVGIKDNFAGYWLETTCRYETVFLKDEKIRYEFNATKPILMKLSGGNYNHTVEGITTQGTLTIPATGKYRFSFSSDEQSFVSFRCYRETGPYYWGDPRKPIEAIMGSIEQKQSSWVSDSTPQIVNGSLGFISFPHKTQESLATLKVISDVFTINTEDGEYILHVGISPECIDYQNKTSNMMGYLTQWDLVNAHKLNMTVSVTGFPFILTRNNTSYRMFHVNDLQVINKTKLPVVTTHSYSLVSGRIHHISVSETTTLFPVNLTTGYTEFDEYGEMIYGNAEHQLLFYLKEGETVHITVNASIPIEYILSDELVSISFQFRGDYLDYQKDITEINYILTASKTGAYRIGIRGFSGATGTVLVNCIRVE